MRLCAGEGPARSDHIPSLEERVRDRDPFSLDIVTSRAGVIPLLDPSLPPLSHCMAWLGCGMGGVAGLVGALGPPLSSWSSSLLCLDLCPWPTLLASLQDWILFCVTPTPNWV